MYTSIEGPFGRPLVRRDADGAIIPADPANADWQAYLAWLKARDAASSPPPRTASTAK